MKIEFSERELKTMRFALTSAMENENSLIDAHSCNFCNGTKFFQDRACICKTGVLRGSVGLVREREKLIIRFKKMLQKISVKEI